MRKQLVLIKINPEVGFHCTLPNSANPVRGKKRKGLCLFFFFPFSEQTLYIYIYLAWKKKNIHEHCSTSSNLESVPAVVMRQSSKTLTPGYYSVEFRVERIMRGKHA